MKNQGASPFRTSMVEIGRGIAALKADLFDKLRVRLTRDLRAVARARNVALNGQRRDGNHTGERVSASARTRHCATS